MYYLKRMWNLYQARGGVIHWIYFIPSRIFSTTKIYVGKIPVSNLKEIALRHSVTVRLLLGAKIPMGVTFYDTLYETHLDPMGIFSSWLPGWERKNSQLGAK